ncbi:hypothetical protein NPIL_656741 [Nephila pilipes]|uniref:BHLH domain-containing protein n=1 Tax=Nephila pilipes TaxID=299642 RepID=A0A8X6JEA9_NEPPI|nr:hypothetical protein NPIL_656741 [Nephila pilipes]
MHFPEQEDEIWRKSEETFRQINNDNPCKEDFSVYVLPQCNYASSSLNVTSSSAGVIPSFSTPSVALFPPLCDVTNRLSSANFAVPGNIESQRTVDNNPNIMGQMPFYDCEANSQTFRYHNVSHNQYNNQENNVTHSNPDHYQMMERYDPSAALANITSEHQWTFSTNPNHISDRHMIKPGNQYVLTHQRSCHNPLKMKKNTSNPNEKKRKPRTGRSNSSIENVQRDLANVRERQRTKNLNEAFAAVRRIVCPKAPLLRNWNALYLPSRSCWLGNLRITDLDIKEGSPKTLSTIPLKNQFI